jgi:hypothetical protein
MGRPCFLCGPFTGYIARTSASPRRGSKPRRTDRLVVGRNVALTLTVSQYGTEFRRVTRRVMARDAIRVGCSNGCRVGSEVFRGREETQLL